jgi:hypothetical protein
MIWLKTTIRCGLMAVCLWAVTAPAAMADMTGLYLAGGPHQLEVIQIIEGDSGELTGRIESYTITERGELDVDSGDLTGTVSGNEFILKSEGMLSALLGSSSLSGRVQRNTLHIIWTGGSAQFQKGSLEQRNVLLQQLNQTALNVAWNNRKNLAEQRFTTAEAQFDALAETKPALMDHLAESRARYEELANAVQQRREHIERLEAIDADWQQTEPLFHQAIAIEQDMISLQLGIDNLFWEVRATLRSIRDGYEHTAAFCDPSDQRLMRLGFCGEISGHRAELDSVIEELRAEYEAWEELKSSSG